MTVGDRFASWIETMVAGWKDAVRGWLLRAIAEGVTRFAEELEPGAIEASQAALTKLRDNPLTPPEMKEFYDKAMTAGNPISVFAGVLGTLLGALGALAGGSQPLGNLMRYDQDRILRSSRLDPMSVITAWRRDPAKYAAMFEDMEEQGWSESRIEALKVITEFLPSPRDLVEWQAKEVFEPDAIAKYGLGDEFERLDLSLFSKAGVTPEQARNFWVAHWEHASWMQVVEMLRRGQMTEEDVWDWFRLVEIPPFWRQKLINISWAVPTRVDVRRFWDLRTIDEPRLREIYTSLGYHGKDLDDYVLWTKIYVALPELIARFKNGWITLAQVKAKLIELGMQSERAEEMLQEKVQAEGADRLKAEKELTKTEIYKGVKMERISRLQGLELLMDLRYDENEANYLLDINVPSDEMVSAVAQRQLTKADVLTGLKAGIITEQGARAMLLDLRYIAVDVEFILKLYRAVVTPPVEPRLKEASKADILLGVKRGLITPEEGYRMLLDIDFSPQASEFILAVHAEESPLSPATYDEFLDRTQRWRLAAGLEGKPVSEEIKKAGAQLVKLTAERDALARAVKAEQAKLLPEEALPVTATARLTELQTALHRAEAELARVKTNYDALVAEWKHGT